MSLGVVHRMLFAGANLRSATGPGDPGPDYAIIHGYSAMIFFLINKMVRVSART
jgi:hypothetical protein